ncbi:MAG TPA: hypothetical protein VKA70_20625 [Blastocatellia bacterium]|nr:hypothetical protein [Blastocatellia bacterium]
MPGWSLSIVVGMPLTVMRVVSTTCSLTPDSPSSSTMATTPASTSTARMWPAMSAMEVAAILTAWSVLST